ncbi:MAG: flavodoxin family protein [Chloroflexota bacterium]
MYVLGLMGSPRRDGNTEILLDAALGAAEAEGARTRKVAVSSLDMRPCLELYHCAVDGTCSLKDDMTPLYDELIAADRIVLASPIFFYGLTSQAKAIVDRCQALWMRRHVLKSWNPDIDARQGALIAVGATKGSMLFDGVVLTAKYFFDAVGVSFSDQVLVRGVDSKGQIREMSQHLEQAVSLGRRLAAC